MYPNEAPTGCGRPEVMSMRSFLMLVIVATVGMAGCNTPTTPIENLEFVVQVTPAVIDPGTTANVAITITNRDQRGVTLLTHDCGSFRVLAQNGAVVGPGSRLCSGELVRRRLESNQGMVIRDTWDGMGLASSGGAPARVPAGEYNVVAWIAAERGIATSGPVVVRVVQ